MEKLMLTLAVVIIVLIAAAVIYRTDRTPKDSKGSARKRSKPTKQKKR